MRALEDVCGSKTDPSGLLAYPTAFVIPARATFFSPLSFCTLKRVRAFSLQSSWSPPDFFTQCWCVYFNFFFFFFINSLEHGVSFQCSMKKKAAFSGSLWYASYSSSFQSCSKPGCFLTMLKCLAYV